MTANEMATNLELYSDRIDSLSSPGWTDAELSLMLNTAQMWFIKYTLDRMNNPKQEGFEETEIRSQGLSELIRNSSALTVSASQTGVLQYGVFYDLPTDFMYTILEEVETNVADCINTGSNVYVPVDVVSHNEYTRLKRNSYKKPFVANNEGLIWRMQFSRTTDSSQADATVPIAATAKRHELVTDGNFNVVSYNIRYLRFPPAVVVDFDTAGNQRNCVLDDATHEAIVEIAKHIAKDSTDRPDIESILGIKTLE